MIKLQYIGIKEPGKDFRVVNSGMFKEELSTLPKGRYRVTVERWRKAKSNPQLGYLFACVYPLVLRALNDAGWEFTSVDEVDEYCKSMFAEREVLNRNTGEILSVPGLKRNFTTTDMMAYIAAIQSWASEFLGVVIPDPEQQIDLNL